MARVFFILIFFLGGWFFVNNVLAEGLKCGFGQVEKAGICFPLTTTTGLSDISVYVLLQRLMWWLLSILGFIGVIAFVISGMQYLLAAGNDDMIETAKRNMTYSIVGMVVALSGLVIIWAIDNWLWGSFFF